MTPKNKTKLKDAAQERIMCITLSAREQQDAEEKTYIVEGYAAKYEPYVLFEDEYGEVKEEFKKSCFDEADMTDIIMQFDHEGRVFARTSNGTLKVELDDVGLKIWADLSKTESARTLYEEIKAGMITKMSWRFRLGNWYYDKKTHTYVHLSIKKIYDVSAVSLPANDNTQINARSFVDGLISEQVRRDAELDIKKRKLKLKIQLKGA